MMDHNERESILSTQELLRLHREWACERVAELSVAVGKQAVRIAELETKLERLQAQMDRQWSITVKEI